MIIWTLDSKSIFMHFSSSKALTLKRKISIGASNCESLANQKAVLF